MSAATMNHVERLERRVAELRDELDKERAAHEATRKDLALSEAYSEVLRGRLEKLSKGNSNAKS